MRWGRRERWGLAVPEELRKGGMERTLLHRVSEVDLE